MKFIDLFAGLGGFHLALKSLGHECVFASELDKNLRDVYYENFGIIPAGDIRFMEPKEIPKHDILCAGFPCQPFSKAGCQDGFKCPKWGDLFQYVLAILKYHKPRYVILENVPNLISHNNGKTWKSIIKRLVNLGYCVDYRKLSPHHFGIPQVRDRVFIIACNRNLKHFHWPPHTGKAKLTIKTILDKNPKGAQKISHNIIKCLNAWQQFLNHYPKNSILPTFPIWSMEFGANYPFIKTTPYKMGGYRLVNYKGSFGKNLSLIKPELRIHSVPSYARGDNDVFPEWKIEFIKKNRELYSTNKKWMTNWLKQVANFPACWQKFEWNCNSGKRNIWEYVIQFRASGVRVKKRTTAPSLIAMTVSQIPIIAWEKRYMTVKECARLQSMDRLSMKALSKTAAYKALGNAVNVDVVRLVAEKLLKDKTKQ